jgi:dihydroflavonol-4-reductase
MENIQGKDVYLITGANGHLGTALIEELKDQDCLVRGLIMPGTPDGVKAPNVTYFLGNITDPETLRPFFAGLEGKNVYVIHTASIIDIVSRRPTPRLLSVNVEGTKNVFRMAEEIKAKRILYVSSVDAFLQQKKLIDEEAELVPLEAKRSAGYPKTKAMATHFVKDEQARGVDALIVYPACIIGPYDKGANRMVQSIRDFIRGTQPGVIPGGYDCVDVRDVAHGILLALKKAPQGASYILSGHGCTLVELLQKADEANKSKHRIRVFPIFLARLGVPFVALDSKIHHRAPTFTNFALDIVTHANSFNRDKAAKELGYDPRPLDVSIKDTVDYLNSHK